VRGSRPDRTFALREKWKLNSTVSNRLFLEDVKRRGEYEKYMNEINEILRAEEEELQLAKSLKELIDQVREQQGPAGSKGRT
jgi:hypothetical protein